MPIVESSVMPFTEANKKRPQVEVPGVQGLSFINRNPYPVSSLLSMINSGQLEADVATPFPPAIPTVAAWFQQVGGSN